MMREHNAHIDVQKSDVDDDEDENNAGGADNGNDDDAEQK